MKPAIMFLDDDTMFLQSLKRFLHSYYNEWEMHFFSDALQAHTALNQREYHVIVADIYMPVVNGVDFLVSSIKKQPIASRIMLSGNTSMENTLDALNRGEIIRYLEKPCHTDDLVAAVKYGIERYENLKQLYAQANNDNLTGLCSRLNIDSKLNEEIERQKRYKNDLSICMIDLDGFKLINDTYGHPVGDLVLKETADILKKSFRKTDHIGRYGGEEFLIIMPETNIKTAVSAVERFRCSMQKHVFHPYGFTITISGGVAKYSAEIAEDLIEKADKLLYQAKKDGKNKIKPEL